MNKVANRNKKVIKVCGLTIGKMDDGRILTNEDGITVVFKKLINKDI